MKHEDRLASLKLDISKTDNIKDQIAILANDAKKFTSSERCSLFIFNKKKDQLRSIYADGIKGSIVLKSNVGIAGYAFHKKTTILENDTATSTIFFKSVDQKTHYSTSTILAVPIINANNQRLGVIELLNKSNGYTQEDKMYIESLCNLFTTLLNASSQKSNTIQSNINVQKTSEGTLQKKFDTHLSNKRLYIMENGSAYYKMTGMGREYFIPADQCYQLEEIEKKIEIHYYSITNEFLSKEIYVKLDKNAEELLISETFNKLNFTAYALEKDA